MNLTEDDFPVRAVGCYVYSPRRPTPIVIAPDDRTAQHIADRLNYSDMAGFQEHQL